MRIIDIILKDLKVLLTDKKTLGIMIIMPIILTTILGVSLGGMFSTDSEMNAIEIAVVKQYDFEYEKEKFLDSPNNNVFLKSMDQKQLEEMKTGLQEFANIEELNPEKMLFDKFLDNKDVKKAIKYQVVDLEKAKKLLGNNKISSIIILPENFIYNMYVNYFPWNFRNETKIEIIKNPDNYMDNQRIEGMMDYFTKKVATPIVGKTTYFETGMDSGIDMMTLSSSGEMIEDMISIMAETNVNLETENVDKQEPLSGVAYYAVAMTAMYILFAAGEGGKLLLEEKDNLTYDRMTMAGISKGKIAVGKYFTIFSFTLIQMLIMILYSTFALGVDWGSKGLVALITICTVFSIAGLGTMLASISFKSGNYKMADAFSSVLVFLFSLIGGSFIPIEVLPKFMHTLGNFIPNGVALKAYNRVIMGGSLTEILPLLLSLVGMGAIFTLIAVYMLNREGGMKHVKYNSATTSKIEG